MKANVRSLSSYSYGVVAVYPTPYRGHEMIVSLGLRHSKAIKRSLSWAKNGLIDRYLFKVLNGSQWFTKGQANES